MLKLKELRENKQISMLQLAQAIGVSDAAISNWENKINEPKASYLLKLADYFQCSIDELLGREDYATGNVVIKGTQLSVDEQQLLELYRLLSVRDKAELIGFAKGLAY